MLADVDGDKKITVNDLIKENNLTSPNLNIGDKLIIPNNEITEEIDEYDIYEIKKGDIIIRINDTDVENVAYLKYNLYKYDTRKFTDIHCQDLL